MIISVNLNYYDNNAYQALEGIIRLLRSQLSGLIRHLKSKK